MTSGFNETFLLLSLYTVFGTDYTLSSSVFTGRPGTLVEIIATFRVDSIAQEVNETAQVRLVLTTSNPPPGAIFQDIIEFVIQDSDGKMPCCISVNNCRGPLHCIKSKCFDHHT